MTWVFLGDSITAAHGYSDYFEAYFHLRYPRVRLHFRGEGRGGTAIPESLEQHRYEKRVDPWSPNVVSEMFGNNGSFSRTQFRNQLEELGSKYIIGKSHAVPVLFGPHPVYRADGKAVLGQFSEELAHVGKSEGWVYADIWHYLHPIWSENQKSPAPVNLQYQAPRKENAVEQTHPGPSGHLAIAFALLHQLKADGEVSHAVLDARKSVVVSSEHTRITGLKSTPKGIDFVRLDERLPMAYDPPAVEIFKLMPQILELNQYLLTVEGLAEGSYEVWIDGVECSTVDAATLARGWNLATLEKGPIHDQLREVLGRIRDKEGVDRQAVWDAGAKRKEVGPPWQGVSAFRSAADKGYNSLNLRGDELKTYLAPQIAAVRKLDDLIYSAAQPVARSFSLRKAAP